MFWKIIFGGVCIFVDKVTYKNKVGIYKITNTANNMVYIGQTRESFNRRYLYHWWSLKNNSSCNKLLQSDWNKYGPENFVFSVVEDVDKSNISSIDQREQYYIQQYRNKGVCYNILEGGNTSRKGVPMSEHAKQLVGAKNKINLTGKKASDATKQKMSATRTGKYYTYTKSTNKLNDDIAYEIKTMLIQGVKPVEIAKDLNINYKFVNNILSSNAWKHVNVDGWEEFRKDRITKTKINQEEREKIITDYINNIPTTEISLKYGRAISTIKEIIRKYNT